MRRLQNQKVVGIFNGRTIFAANEGDKEFDGADLRFVASIGEEIPLPERASYGELNLEIMDRLSEEQQGQLQHFMQWHIDHTDPESRRNHVAHE